MASKDRKSTAFQEASEMQDSVEAIDSKEKNDQKESHPNRLRTGLLVIGSALLGGIAVVLWNRRGLTDMRNQAQESPPKPIPVDEDAIY
jgi:hypothetical protein